MTTKSCMTDRFFKKQSIECWLKLRGAWGIDESINGTGLLKRNCKKMPVLFRHWHFISIHGKIDVCSCKAQKERKVRLYEVTQVFRMGNGILLCHDDNHRL